MTEERIISFIARCPNGHKPTQEYRADVLRAALDKGSLRLSCITCDEHWNATPDEIAGARRLLDREAR